MAPLSAYARIEPSRWLLSSSPWSQWPDAFGGRTFRSSVRVPRAQCVEESRRLVELLTPEHVETALFEADLAGLI